MTRFVVDAMLGRLSLWLRLAGFDTLYSTEMHDDELLAIAKEEKRVLLTSDEKLHNRAIVGALESMLLRGSVDERVIRVFCEFDIPPRIDPSKSRCSKCNGELTEVGPEDKERVRGLVFEETLKHYDRFWLCNSCESVFFQGGQWLNIQRYMEKIERLMHES
ncbi:MAG: Mut7-C RNAse domain-containing protein [Promethearchaeota archaeon]